MTTITLLTGQVSQVTFVPAGSRITSSGSGSIEWMPGTPTDAANSPNWSTWAKGSAAGYMDTLRAMSIRATATGSMTVTIEEGFNDKYGEDAYFDGDYPTLSTVNDNTVLVGGGVKIRPGGDLLGTPVVLYEGDSITARYNLTVFPAVEGGANFASGHGTGSYATFEQAFLQNVYLADCNAVSGETIEQITTRLLATDISDYAVVSLLVGANNYGGSVLADAATDMVMIRSVCDYCLEQHKPLRIGTMLPPDTSMLDANENAYILAFNNAIKALPQTYPNVFVADMFATIQDATAADPTPVAGTIYTGDGSKVHPTKIGSYLVSANAAVDAMEAALRYAGYGHRIDSKTEADDGVAYTELLTNTNFKTQTGGLDSTAGLITAGAVPSGWRIVKLATPTDVKIYYPFYVAEATRQRGMWAASKAYAVGDAVTTAGASYICIVAHTSATFASEGANWKRVWSTDYCWQVEFTADAAGDGITLQRQTSLSIAATDLVQGFCGIAVEGDVAKIKGSANGPFLLEAYGAVRAHFNCALYPPSGVTEESVGERFEGMFQTSRQAFFSGGGTITAQQFKVESTLNAAGTASVILYKPSVRKY